MLIGKYIISCCAFKFQCIFIFCEVLLCVISSMYQPLSLFFWAYKSCRVNNLFPENIPHGIKTLVSEYDEMLLQYNKKEEIQYIKDTLMMWNWRVQTLLPDICFDYLLQLSEVPEFVDESMWIVRNYYMKQRRDWVYHEHNNWDLCPTCFQSDIFVDNYTYMHIKDIYKGSGEFITGSILSNEYQMYCDICKFTPLYELWPIDVFNLQFALSQKPYIIDDYDFLEDDDNIFTYSQYVTHPKLL